MKRNIIHDGVSIKIFETDDPQKVIIHFTDEITAFNKIKKAVIKDKGVYCNGISCEISRLLQKGGVPTHFIEQEELERIYSLTKQVNSILTPVFKEIGITLVDFKIEFGHLCDGSLVMSDDITPDSARFWDIATGDRLDKDRFRKDNGHVGEAYRTVYERLTGKKV